MDDQFIQEKGSNVRKVGNSLILETAISISRVTSNARPDYVQITLTDRGSGITFADVTLTIEEFGSVLSGMSYTHCVTEVGGLDKLGKVHEHKTEHIPGLGYDTWEQRFEMVKPYETDGWKADSYDLKTLNMHRANREDDTYSVTFRRWVDPPAEKKG